MCVFSCETGAIEWLTSGECSQTIQHRTDADKLNSIDPRERTHQRAQDCTPIVSICTPRAKQYYRCYDGLHSCRLLV